jgi:UDP-glucose 4-epimerase
VTAAIDRPSLTVFVTGAAGFIGSALCHRLVSAGHDVIAYDNLSRGSRDRLPAAVRLIEGDIRDPGKLAGAFADARPDAVVHLAAMHFIPDCIARPQETLDVNVEGTRLLLDACRGGSIRRLVFASSAAVYAPIDDPCVEATTPLGPLEIYGESKLAGETLAATFWEETRIPVSVLRLFNAVGRHETNPHVIPHIFESLRRSDTIPLGNVAPRRDYIDTRDIADLMLRVLDGPQTFQVLNAGTGVARSVSDIVEMLRRILGRPIVIETESSRARATERMTLVADRARVERETGWKPRIGLEDALRDLAVAYGLQPEPRLAG